MVYICIGKQKVIWIPKLRENGWEAAASAIRRLKAKKAYSHLPDTYEFFDIYDFLFYSPPLTTCFFLYVCKNPYT